MKLRFLAVAAATLALTACGGKAGGSVPAGADVAPASAAAFIWVNTDLKSDQLKTARALLDKFPGRDELFAQISKGLAEQHLDFKRDVEPALGTEVDVVWLDFANNGDDVVGLTKPRDKAKFQKLLQSDTESPAVSDEYQGWTIFASKQELLNRFKSAAGGKSLSDDDAFSKAFGSLDENTIVRSYVSGTALNAAYAKGFAGQTTVKPEDFISFGPIVASSKAQSDGARIDADAELHVKLNPDPTPTPYTAKLPNEVPAGALLYVSYAQLDKDVRATMNQLSKILPNFSQQRSQVESALGTSLERDVYPLLSGEAAFAIYPAAPIPRFMFVLSVKDEAKANQLAEKVNALLAFSGQAAPKTVNVRGLTVYEIRPPGTSYTIDYAIFDNKLVIENGRAGIAAMRRGGSSLADDPLYKAARDGANAPDKSIGFVYANLHAGLPVAFAYARKSGDKVPPEAVANTKPLQSSIITFTRDGDHFKGTGFVGIK